ncbi:hypothetical protein Hdeb2414_s0124g00804331 [Helianthus debilis subsp. tardiflorus]
MAHCKVGMCFRQLLSIYGKTEANGHRIYFPEHVILRDRIALSSVPGINHHCWLVRWWWWQLNLSMKEVYSEMASHHRVRNNYVRVIITTTIPAKLCKESTRDLWILLFFICKFCL